MGSASGNVSRARCPYDLTYLQFLALVSEGSTVRCCPLFLLEMSFEGKIQSGHGCAPRYVFASQFMMPRSRLFWSVCSGLSRHRIVRSRIKVTSRIRLPIPFTVASGLFLHSKS